MNKELFRVVENQEHLFHLYVLGIRFDAPTSWTDAEAGPVMDKLEALKEKVITLVTEEATQIHPDIVVEVEV